MTRRIQEVKSAILSLRGAAREILSPLHRAKRTVSWLYRYKSGIHNV